MPDFFFHMEIFLPEVILMISNWKIPGRLCAMVLGLLIAFGTGLSTAGATEIIFDFDKSHTKLGANGQMVEYDVIEQAAKAVGFQPMDMPEGVPYRQLKLIVINNKTVEATYERIQGMWETKDSVRAQYTIRSARRADVKNDDVSGIYGQTWEETTIAGMKVYKTQLSKRSWIIRWTQGEYAYSVMGRYIDEATYTEMMTEHILPYALEKFGKI